MLRPLVPAPITPATATREARATLLQARTRHRHEHHGGAYARDCQLCQQFLDAVVLVDDIHRALVDP